MIRSIPEWSEQECLLLALPHPKTDWKPYLDEILLAYKNFIQAIIPFQKVLLIAPSQKDFEPFLHFQNVEFFECPTNDTWIRDFGAIGVWEGAKVKALDFTFNAWGNKFESSLDNAVNSKLFKDKLKQDLQKIDLVLEGGSVDFNGKGTMLTSSYCLLNPNRNSHLSKTQLERKLKDIFGLSEILWLENGFIKGDDTDHHIDTLARFIDENTIAFCVCEDEKDEHFKPLSLMKQELEKTSFKLLELPLPKPLFYENQRLGASYANFVFINDALIMPFYADENDELVKARLEKALPNRKVIGVDARVFLRQNGSLHCACQNLFKDWM